MCSPRSLALVAMLCAAAPAVAQSFGAGNLVVMRVGNANPTGSGDVILDEFTTGGAAVGHTIALPTAGVDAVSLSSLTNHDRHLHLSSDGRFLALAAYGAAPSTTDPATLPASAVPRVAGLVRFD